MKPILFQTTDWESVPVVERKGSDGVAFYRTKQFDGVRVRIVEYSPGYSADHWCRVGHIVYCINGEMTSELADGRSFKVTEGMSYIVSDEMSWHRSITEKGVKLMIIDGDFLSTTKKHVIENPWKL
ncbi:MAG TPA: DHCW motif cupin fold protein [Chryseosolibacter sp.]|nr:DHCW motif cupin fold protein [Chryseosolibacter sp.]